ncbi:centrosomal protein of 70 kDa-like [Corticium candelabrum]|uniref:centrosomal protein of 70 kDa-like n=1 Tax=Corticium candelabrum TaxID=121492 RepID=UPI002E2742FA|nr:centrosomal protein of 70 kDa-like [Corticium candelabrum]
MSISGSEGDACSLTADLRATKEKIEQLLTIYKSSDGTNRHDTSATDQHTQSNRNNPTHHHPNPPTQSDWQRVNEMLRQRGMHPVSFLQPSDVFQTRSIVVMDDVGSHSLQALLFSLLVECDKKQSIIEEWMNAAHRDRVAFKEENERNYKLQQEIDELRRQTQTDRMRIEEMESCRVNELRRHGEELQKAKSAASAMESRHRQLEVKCRQQETTLAQMQDKQYRLLEMEEKRKAKHHQLLSGSRSFPKRLPESKSLEMVDAYETRIEKMQEELHFLRQEVAMQDQSHVTHSVSRNTSYLPLFVRLKDAEEHCSTLQASRAFLVRENAQLKEELMKRKDEKASQDSEITQQKRGRNRTRQGVKRDDILSLSLSTCQQYLQSICHEMGVRSVSDALSKLRRLSDEAEAAHIMEQLVKEILQLIESPGTPHKHPVDSQPTVDTTNHKLWCEFTQKHITTTLQHWVSILTSKSHQKSDEDDLLLMVTHFQKLFHVPSQSGVITQMSEVCSRLEEYSNVLQNIKDLLRLEPTSSSAKVVMRVDSLMQSFQHENVHNRVTVQDKLEEYEEFIPAFQGLISQLLSILKVSSLDDIVPLVRQLIHNQDSLTSDE